MAASPIGPGQRVNWVATAAMHQAGEQAADFRDRQWNQIGQRTVFFLGDGGSALARARVTASAA